MFKSNIEKIKDKKDKKNKKDKYYDCEIQNILDNTVSLLTIHDKISEFLLECDKKKKVLNEKIYFLKKYDMDYYNSLFIELYKNQVDKLNKYFSYEEYYLLIIDTVSELKIFEDNINKYDITEISYKRKHFKQIFSDKLGIHPTNYICKDIQYDCCEKGSIYEDTNELVCWICGKVYNTNIIQNIEDNLNYRDLEDYYTNKKAIPEYHKSSHLKEKLEQKLGLNISYIPIEIINKVKEQLNKEKIKIENLKINDIHKILKKLGYEKFYEFEYAIYNYITNTKLLSLDNIVIKQIESLFTKIENCFKDIKYKNRKSMFMYDYTIRKILEILGYIEESKHFNPPKDRTKVLDYDKIWKEICTELNFKFIPTN
jgi:hypothetical protein